MAPRPSTVEHINPIKPLKDSFSSKPTPTRSFFYEKVEDAGKAKVTRVGFEPTPMKTTALTLRLRPLGHRVVLLCCDSSKYLINYIFFQRTTSQPNGEANA
jgi:hypothetical protein